MATLSVEKPVIFDMSKMAESRWNIRLELDLDALNFTLIDLFFLEIILLGKFDVSLG